MIDYGKELLLFGVKMAWASIFGAVLLFFILLTQLYYPFADSLNRFDFLFFVALLTQALLLLFKLESWREVRVILVFHLVATGMEIFKTHPAIGSWSYPGAEGAIFAVMGVPLFAGFMYSAVGSFIARAWRILNLRYHPFPDPRATLLLSALIYLNFFTHHFIWDFRYGLLGLSVWMFWPTTIQYRVSKRDYQMPFMMAGGLTAFFVWVAENIGTFSGAWLYPHQQFSWSLVSPQKLVSWYMLLLLSFGLVSLLYRKPHSES